MTARELINKLMDLNLDKEIYITRPIDKNSEHGYEHQIGYANNIPIEPAEQEIIDVGVHGLYGTYLNCITIDVGSYLTTISGKIIYNSEFADEIKDAIILEAKHSNWDHYGWTDKIRKAETLDEILNAFSIEYIDMGNGWVSCTMNYTYNSPFLPYLVNCCAEYLENSEMKIRNNVYNKTIKIKINNGKVIMR